MSMGLQGSKPWRYTGKEENMDREDIKSLVKRWWDVYEDESLDFDKIVSNTLDYGQRNNDKLAGNHFIAPLPATPQRNAPSAA